jgi:hypothetical protein
MPEMFRFDPTLPIPFDSTAEYHRMALPKPSDVTQTPTQSNDPPIDAYHTYIPSDHHHHHVSTYQSPVRPSNTVAQRPRRRIYDRPGQKPGAKYESNTAKLAAAHAHRGGTSAAVAWIHKAFKDGVTLPALVRFLTPEELDDMGFMGGFMPAQAYDGFLEKIGDRFECGLCAEDSRANWKHKKDSIRHFRKFHLGLGKSCTKWWGACLCS